MLHLQFLRIQMAIASMSYLLASWLPSLALAAVRVLSVRTLIDLNWEQSGWLFDLTNNSNLYGEYAKTTKEWVFSLMRALLLAIGIGANHWYCCAVHHTFLKPHCSAVRLPGWCKILSTTENLRHWHQLQVMRGAPHHFTDWSPLGIQQSELKKRGHSCWAILHDQEASFTMG
jgi:hypothetical protein